MTQTRWNYLERHTQHGTSWKIQVEWCDSDVPDDKTETRYLERCSNNVKPFNWLHGRRVVWKWTEVMLEFKRNREKLTRSAYGPRWDVFKHIPELRNRKSHTLCNLFARQLSWQNSIQSQVTLATCRTISANLQTTTNIRRVQETLDNNWSVKRWTLYLGPLRLHFLVK